MPSTVYAAPDQRKVGSRAPRDRQVVVVLLVLLAVNGLVCWLNTLQHTGRLNPVIHLGNYLLLGVWFGAFALVRTSRHLWEVVAAGLVVIASHAYLFVVRPGYFVVGPAFLLTNACEVLLLVVLVIQELRARRATLEPRSEPMVPLAQVVPLRGGVAVSESAEVRRAA